MADRPWLLILGLATIIRIIYFITRYPYAGENFLLVDTLFHHKWAVAIASGDWLGRETFFRAPLYPYILGLLYFIFGKSAHVGFVFGQFLGLVSIYLTYRLAVSVFNKKSALIAALFQAVYPLMIYFEGELLVEVFFIVLMQASILSLFKASESDHPKWPVLVGLFLGLAAITRAVVLPLVPLYLTWYYLNNCRSGRVIFRTVVILLIMFLVITPVALRNILIGHDSTLIASSGGINFFIGNNEQADGLSASLPLPLGGSWRIEDITYAAESATGREMTPSEVSSYYYDRGWDWILNNKIDFMKLYIKKLYYSLNNFEVSNNRNLVYEFSHNGLLKFLPLSFWLIIGLATVGLFASTDGRIQNRRRIFLILLIVLYILTISLYFINARFRLPMLFVLFLFAGAGIIWIYDSVRTRKHPAKVLAAVLSGAVVAAFSLTNFYRHDARDITGGLFNLGNAFFAAGDYASAVEHYHRVLDVRPDYPDAALNLGAIFLISGQTDSARVYFEREFNLYPDNPRSLANLASLQYLEGHPDSAIVLADRAIALRPYFSDPYIIKLRSLAVHNDIQGVNQLLEKLPRNIADAARIYLEAGIIYSQFKDFSTAGGYLDSAYTMPPVPSEIDDAAFSNISKIGGRDITAIRARAAYQLGYINGLAGNYGKSVDYSNAAIALDSNLVEAYINLVSGLMSLGNTEQARRVLALADRKFPGNETIAILKSRLQ